MEELPFLAGPMSPQLAQQRAYQCTSQSLNQLMTSPEYLAWRRRRIAFVLSGAVKYLLGLIVFCLLVFFSAQFMASNQPDHDNNYTVNTPSIVTTTGVVMAPHNHVDIILSPISPPSYQLLEGSAARSFLVPEAFNPCAAEESVQVLPAIPTPVNDAAIEAAMQIIAPDTTGLHNDGNYVPPPFAMEPVLDTSSTIKAASAAGTMLQSVQPLQSHQVPIIRTSVLSYAPFAVAVMFLVVALASAAANCLDFAFVSSVNVAAAADDEDARYGAPRADAASIMLALTRTGGQGIGNPPLPQMEGQAEEPACSQPAHAVAHAGDDAHAFTRKPPSPLLYVPLASAAQSLAKPKFSQARLRLSVSKAMDMLTPTEPPSPFPGFPPLSRFANQSSAANTTGDDNIGFMPEELTFCIDGGTTGAKQPPYSSQGSSSWGSGSKAATSPSVNFVGEVLAAPRSVSATLCLFSHPPTTQTPASTVFSVNDASQLDAMFDLNCFDEEGEEVTSAPSLAYMTHEAHLEGIVDKSAQVIYPPPCRQVKLRFPSHKAKSDVRPSDVSDEGSNGSGDHGKLPDRVLEAATPTWPPTKSANAFESTAIGLELVETDAPADEELIANEALSLSKSLSGSTYESGCRRLFLSPGSASNDDVLLQPRSDPGREYAAVAAAASVLVASVKGCAKAVVLSAIAGDEATLHAAQSDLHSAVTQLLDMDLAPHACTSSSGACKMLAYSSAATPVLGLSFPGSGSSGDTEGRSWASVGSLVASGSLLSATVGGPFSPAGHSNGTPLPDPYGGADDAWVGGPGDLPKGIDAYLASRSKGSPASAHVLTALQESLAYAGLLMNTLGSELLSVQRESAIWRSRALAALRKDANENSVGDRSEFVDVPVFGPLANSVTNYAIKNPAGYQGFDLVAQQPRHGALLGSLQPGEASGAESGDEAIRPGVVELVDEMLSQLVMGEPIRFEEDEGVVFSSVAVSPWPAIGGGSNLIYATGAVQADSASNEPPAPVRSGSDSNSAGAVCKTVAAPPAMSFEWSEMASRISTYNATATSPIACNATGEHWCRDHGR